MRTEGAGLENDGQYWSEADKSILLALFNEGVGITEIALKLGRSEPAILQQLVKERMFEHETQVRRSRKSKNQCQCPTCSYYETCRHSPLNRCYTVCSMEGENVHA